MINDKVHKTFEKALSQNTIKDKVLERAVNRYKEYLTEEKMNVTEARLGIFKTDLITTKAWGEAISLTLEEVLKFVDEVDSDCKKSHPIDSCNCSEGMEMLRGKLGVEEK